MLRIAITGGIACGKSLAASFLPEGGIAVCDSDDLAKDLMQPGRSVFDEVVSAFGEDILAGDGTIDRSVLGRRVFADSEQLAVLNGLVHPGVKVAWQAWLEEREGEGCRAAAVIVPLLYEVGAGEGWDAVVCVAASERRQLNRLEARGMTSGEAGQRIGAQMKMAAKMSRSDYVIHNDGTKEMLKQQTMKVVENILEKSDGNEK